MLRFAPDRLAGGPFAWAWLRNLLMAGEGTRRPGGLFILAVLVPTLFSIVYFGFWASDVYVSESRFVVRNRERAPVPSIGNLLQGAGLAGGRDESQSVREYILSRDAARALEEKIGLKKSYASKGVDLFSRFAGIDGDDSFEAFHEYYQRKVDARADSNSSIVTLTLRAYTPQDALAGNRTLLDESEALVNRLNDRSRRDLIRYAEAEVAKAEARARAAATAMSAYRNQNSVVDPERQAGVQLQQVAKLQDELIATSTQLAQLQAFTPANPQIETLRARVRTLQGEIAKETSRVAGGPTSLANKAAQFQHFAIESEIATKQLASALAGLEVARNEALRQQVYVERIAEPSLPDSSREPKRLRAILATLVFGIVAWGLLTMIVAGVREHAD
jgi:capsular polysaccharide transport system permease protein